MAAYSLDNDRHYVRSFETGSLSVYELKEKDGAAETVGEESWSRQNVSSSAITTLKVGETEIRGQDLTNLMKILYFSELLVNCRGDCFVRSGGVIAVEQEETPARSCRYYKAKCRFDWSGFRIKKPDQENDPNWLKEELKTHVFDRAGLTGSEFFHSLVDRTRVQFPAENFTLKSTGLTMNFSTANVSPKNVVTPMDTKPDDKTLSLAKVHFQVTIGNFETNGWWLIAVAVKGDKDHQTKIKYAVYYDGATAGRHQKIGNQNIPVTFQAGTNVKSNHKFGIDMIHGLGVRCVFYLNIPAPQ